MRQERKRHTGCKKDKFRARSALLSIFVSRTISFSIKKMRDGLSHLFVGLCYPLSPVIWLTPLVFMFTRFSCEHVHALTFLPVHYGSRKVFFPSLSAFLSSFFFFTDCKHEKACLEVALLGFKRGEGQSIWWKKNQRYCVS